MVWRSQRRGEGGCGVSCPMGAPGLVASLIGTCRGGRAPGCPMGARGGDVGAEPVAEGMAQPELHCPDVCPQSWCLPVCLPPRGFCAALLDPSSINSCRNVGGAQKVLISVMPCREKLIVISSRRPPTEEAQAAAEPQVSAW